MKHLGSLFVTFVALCGLAGCTPPAPKPTGPQTPSAAIDKAAPGNQPPAGGKSVLVISNATSPFWDAVETGLKAGSQEFGVASRLERNDGSVAGQIKLLEQALTAKEQLQGVAVSVLRPDAEGILAAMKKLQEAGVPVLTVDSDAQAASRKYFVGTDNLEAGRQLGKKAAELLPKGAKVCFFVGDPSSQNAKDRQKGFEDGAGKAFQTTEVYKDDTDPTKARTNVESALVAHKDVTLLVGLWSYNGPAIGEAVKNAGKEKDVTVLAFDAEPNLLALVEQGKIAATMVQQPYEMGRQVVGVIKALGGDAAAQKLLPKTGDHVDTGLRLVTKDNFAEFRKYLDEKGLKSS